MANGTEPGRPSQSQQAQGNVVALQVVLTAKHVAAAFAALCAGVGGMVTTGWLVLPAKQTDLTALQASVAEVRTMQQQARDERHQIKTALDGLTRVVADFDEVLRAREIALPKRGRR